MAGIQMSELAMRQVLAELETLSQGTCANWSPTGRSSDSKGGNRPPGDAHPPHVYWREQWDRAVGSYDQEKVIRSARAELESWRKRPEVTVQLETEDELADRIVKEGKGSPVDEIAQHCRCTPTFVRKARLKAGVSLVTGIAPKGVTVETQDQREQVRELAENGLSERQIGMFTGLGKGTIRRVLGRAA